MRAPEETAEKFGMADGISQQQWAILCQVCKAASEDGSAS